MYKAGGTVSKMGEMAMRSRPRKDLAASFHRLRRMVVDVKSARKSLVAQHSLVAELVSVAFYSSSKDPLPCNDLHREDPQEESVSLAILPLNPPAQSPCPPSQLHDLQEAGIETQSSLPCSLSKTADSPSFSKNSASFPTSSVVNGEISCVSPSHQEADSNCNNVPTSAAYPGKRLSQPCNKIETAAYPGKRLSQPAFWVSLFLVFLCFFLCMGKEIAVVVAISAYVIIRLARRIRIAQRQCSYSHCFVDSVSYNEDHLEQEIPGSNLGRSSTVPEGVIFCSLDPRAPPIRSRSFPTLSSSLEDDVCLKDPGLSLYPEFSAATNKAVQSFSGSLKLSVILVLALFGLAYSHFVAVCLCSCCIFLISSMQELVPRVYRLNS